MLVRKGAENFVLSKLLAIILRIGKAGMSAEDLAKILLNRYGSLRALDSVSFSELSKIEGIGLTKAVQIKAAFVLWKKLFKELAQTKKKLKKPDDVISYVAEYYVPYLRDKDKDKEFFYVILLDNKNEPIDNIDIIKDSMTATVFVPKEIVKEALLKSASSIILVHNHPLGKTKPS